MRSAPDPPHNPLLTSSASKQVRVRHLQPSIASTYAPPDGQQRQTDESCLAGGTISRAHSAHHTNSRAPKRCGGAWRKTFHPRPIIFASFWCKTNISRAYDNYRFPISTAALHGFVMAARRHRRPRPPLPELPTRGERWKHASGGQEDDDGLNWLVIDRHFITLYRREVWSFWLELGWDDDDDDHGEDRV